MKSISLPLSRCLSIFSMVIVIVWGAGCESAPKKFDDPTMSIDVRSGHEFEITMEANPSTGYSWQLTSAVDGTCVKLLGHDYRQNEPTLVGSAGAEVWRFRGLTVGSTRIAFQYVRPWEKNVAPAQVREYRVDVLP